MCLSVWLFRANYLTVPGRVSAFQVEINSPAIKSAFLLGAERVIAIDRFPERLRMARERCGAETINYEQADVLDTLKELTGGRGPDHCIDAVGMEAHRQARCTLTIAPSRR